MRDRVWKRNAKKFVDGHDLTFSLLCSHLELLLLISATEIDRRIEKPGPYTYTANKLEAQFPRQNKLCYNKAKSSTIEAYTHTACVIS